MGPGLLASAGTVKGNHSQAMQVKEAIGKKMEATADDRAAFSWGYGNITLNSVHDPLCSLVILTSILPLV